MIAVHPRYLKCTAYLYPSISAGQLGERFGGTAFFVAFEAPDGDGCLPYVVTNKHLVDGGCRFLRISLKDGESYTDEVPLELWTFSVDDDLAVAGLTLPKDHDVMPIGTDLFLGEDCAIGSWPIFPGDNVMFYGRLIGHDGRERNKPVMRFGNVAMLPDPDALINFKGHEQLAYLVECRSIGGFSGSPAFVQLARPRLTYHAKGESPQPQPLIPRSPKFLGVNCGHLPFYGEGRERPAWDAPKIPDVFVETSSGMAVIIPAWRLMNLLNQEHLVRQREEILGRARAPETAGER